MAGAIKKSRIFFGVATIFFFFGWVIFEGVKVEFFGGMVSPYVVIGFGFTFIGMIYEFDGTLSKFIKKLTNL